MRRPMVYMQKSHRRLDRREMICRSAQAATSLALGGGFLAACKSGVRVRNVGVAFDTLQTEYWVASIKTLEAQLSKSGFEMLQAIADGDANRQFEQVRNFIARNVAGIVIAPKDKQTVIPMIKAANKAKIPVVLYNRPPAPSDTKSTTVVADNFAITKKTVDYMVEVARKSGKKYEAMILIGDLGDENSIGRRDGFEASVSPNSDLIKVVSRVPTEWNQEKALAGVTNALQANPGINFIFTSSDFLFASIVSALKGAGKYKKIGEEGHVLMGGFDGDATAYQMLVDGYLDADGVQDMEFECNAAVRAIVDLEAGKSVEERILDPGFVIHQANLGEMESRMWGAKVAKGSL